MLLELSRNPDYSPGTLILPDGDPSGLDFSDKSLGAEVDVVNNFSGTTPVSTPDGSLAPGRVWLRSRGRVSGTFYRSQRYTARAIVTRPEVVLNYALRQAVGPIKLGAANTVRSYVPAGDLDPKPPGVLGANLRVRANETGLSLGGGALIDGVVEIPTTDTPVSGTPSGGTEVVQDGPASLKFSEPLAFRPLPHPDAIGSSLDLPPGQPYGQIEVQPGGTLVLHAGEYYAINLVLRAGARLVVSGATVDDPCVFYIGSGFGASGNNEVNWEGAPRLLQFYDTDIQGDGRNSSWISSGARMSCVWASRETAVNFGDDVEFYGALDGHSFTFGSNCHLVFDETLVGEVLEGKAEWVVTKKER